MEENEDLRCDERTVAFLNTLKARGVLGDVKIKDKALREAKRQHKINAYHNTLKLLQQYRMITWTLECFPDTLATELDVPVGNLDKLIERLDTEIAFGNKRLENRLAGVEKTRMILDRVNDALTVLKKYPNDGVRLYELIYLTYIAPETLTHFDLLYRLNMSTRHYYRLREQAIKVISMRLWSADESELGFWLEVMAVIEQLNA